MKKTEGTVNKWDTSAASVLSPRRWLTEAAGTQPVWPAAASTSDCKQTLELGASASTLVRTVSGTKG